MIILFFSILWGSLITLILCAPYGYYPIFYSIFIISIIIFFAAKKYFKSINKYFYSVAVIIFFISYALGTYVIFKPHNFHYPSAIEVSKDKEAVIFYCEGEMEKYTPYYSNYFLKDTPLLLKPIYSLGLKRMYKQTGIDTKNNELLKVAGEVRESLLNYKPYYFYIAFSGYIPSLKDSISSSISDGCSCITIINYSADYKFEDNLNTQIDIEKLKSMGIAFKITKPIHSMSSFIDMYSSFISSLPEKYDGILIIDVINNTSTALKLNILRYGYRDSQIQISTDLPKALEYFKSEGAKSIFYLNLTDSGTSLRFCLTTKKEFEKYYNVMSIKGKDSWGSEKGLVKASIDSFLQAEKSQVRTPTP